MSALFIRRCWSCSNLYHVWISIRSFSVNKVAAVCCVCVLFCLHAYVHDWAVSYMYSPHLTLHNLTANIKESWSLCTTHSLARYSYTSCHNYKAGLHLTIYVHVCVCVCLNPKWQLVVNDLIGRWSCIHNDCITNSVCVCSN